MVHSIYMQLIYQFPNCCEKNTILQKKVCREHDFDVCKLKNGGSKAIKKFVFLFFIISTYSGILKNGNLHNSDAFPVVRHRYRIPQPLQFICKRQRLRFLTVNYCNPLNAEI